MRHTSSTVHGSQRAKFPDAMLTWFKIYESTVVIKSGFMLKSGNSALQSSSSTSTWYTPIAYAPRSRARAARETTHPGGRERPAAGRSVLVTPS